MSVSVIIPSDLSNRHDWLKHALSFLYRNGFTGEVVVGVWGGYNLMPDLSDFCRDWPVRIFAQDGADLFTERWLEMARKASGDYIIQIGDDDFLMSEALDKMAATLASDPSISAVQGRTLSIYRGADGWRLIPFPMWPATEPDALSRLENYATHTGQTFHAMMRHVDFLEKLSLMNAAATFTGDHIWFEIIGDLYALIKGRFAIIDDIFILRSKHADNTSRVFLRDHSDKMFPYHLLSNNFTTHYKFFEGQLFALLKSCGVDTGANRKAIKDAVLNLLGSIIYSRRGPRSLEECTLIESLHIIGPKLFKMVDDAKP